MNGNLITTLSLMLEFLLQLVFIIRILLKPNREPSSRIAWIAVISALPFAGVVIYLMFGETNIGRKRVQRRLELQKRLPGLLDLHKHDSGFIPDEYRHLFTTGQSVNGFEPVGGNRGVLMKDSDDTIDSMVADMDEAGDHINIEFYIWLTDKNGLKVVEALKRAAARGVTCRAMADSLGSRAMIGSRHWKSMADTGVHVVKTLPFGGFILRPFRGRIDLRNHRKIVVIDNRITYCGSQNCADPEFAVKPRFAPWVDAMIRFEGPIVMQNQFLFAGDWMAEVDEDLRSLLNVSIPPIEGGFSAQVIGTGPTNRNSAMPEVFQALIYAARKELVISTPYYVPDEPIQRALCASARRGVRTRMIFPARIDSRLTSAACHSNYAGLLEAGVEIYEYVGGLLHTKSLTIDGEVTLIGSANMDRRSFELNYENNIMFSDRNLTAEVRRRQDSYIARSNPVTAESVEQWPWTQRLWNNALSVISPVL